MNSANWVPLAVLAASIAGSAHCVSMCGGLVVAAARTKKSWIAYHGGRLFGYLVLGAIAGYLGGTLLNGTETMRWLSLFTALLLGIGFLISGFRVWQGKLPHLSILPRKTVFRLHRRADGNAFLMGMFTAILPCGWLHVFVLGAVATRSAVTGSTFLFMFWLGTLPALAATPWLVNHLFRPLSRRAPRVAALMLMSAGLICIGTKIQPLIAKENNVNGLEETHCHDH